MDSYKDVYDLSESIAEVSPYGILCAARLGNCVSISMVNHDGPTFQIPLMTKKEFDNFVHVMNKFQEILNNRG